MFMLLRCSDGGGVGWGWRGPEAWCWGLYRVQHVHFSCTFPIYCEWYACIFMLFISVYSCVYLAPASSPEALCATASVLLWLPGAPEGFFSGICWQINAAGLANCSFSNWHQAQRTLNTKRWTLFSLFVSHQCSHTNNKTALCKTKNFRWAQFEEKAPNPA